MRKKEKRDVVLYNAKGLDATLLLLPELNSKKRRLLVLHRKNVEALPKKCF